MKTERDILVIDDELMVTQAVVKVCSLEGMTVAAADNATDALRFLEDNNFRLALCDIMMSGLDGFQFLEELNRRGIQTPVVMMTGYSTVENAVRSLTSTGAVDYIAKPFTADELLTVVRRSLRCAALLEEAESAGLPRHGSMSYVPCPANSLRGRNLTGRIKARNHLPDGWKNPRGQCGRAIESLAGRERPLFQRVAVPDIAAQPGE